MTLLDFCRLLKRYIALMVALPLICALGCFVYLTVFHGVDTKCSAVSRIVVSSHVQDVTGLTAGQVRSATITYPDMQIKSSVDTNTRTVTVTVVGSSGQEVVDVANEVAESVRIEAEGFVPNSIEDPFNARVEKASIEKLEPSKDSRPKYVLIAVLVGLFVAVGVIVVIDTVKRPIKSVENVRNAIGFPILESFPVQDGGERLLAHVRFASKKEPRTVCVMPISCGDSAEDVLVELATAAKAEGLVVCSGIELINDAEMAITRCESLNCNIQAAYTARKVDSVILVVCQWTDTLSDLESAIAEVEIAGIDLTGVVFIERKR